MKPEELTAKWEHGDDCCDCTFQRIGEWSNPYLARTLRVRLCCIWEELYKMFPQHVQVIEGCCHVDENGMEVWDTVPHEWDSEDGEMPKHLWHRHTAARDDISVADARVVSKGKVPPQPKVKEVESDGQGKAKEANSGV